MQFPENLKYTSSHEWIKSIDDDAIIVGITDFAQRELGDIVYVDINALNKDLKSEEAFGSIEAIKTVSDLFMPLDGKIVEVNPEITTAPEKINQSPYEEGWIVKIKMTRPEQLNDLLSAEAYKKMVE